MDIKTGIKFIINILLTISVVSACDNLSNKKIINNQQIDSTFKNKLIERQIGKSAYYISIPENYSIKETEGPDFSVFYFSPTDTTIKTAFSGGLYFGNFPQEFKPENKDCTTESIKGTILNNNKDWTVYNCKEKYFIQTIVDSKSGESWNEKIHAFGHGNSKSDINKILEIYSTLKKK